VQAYDVALAARALVFDVPGWPGHLAGQHVDVRLTAEDGYSTERSYSIAAPADGDRVELTVQRVDDGEVSPYLVDDVQVGDVLELRGPIGGYFVWRPAASPSVLLLGGGSGVVPLMTMIRARSSAGGSAPMRLLYSVRTPAELYYAGELQERMRADAGLEVTVLYTRAAPPGELRAMGRLTADDIARAGWPDRTGARAYVCGPTGFVEAAAGLLVAAGGEPSAIRTERFGPTGT
jgi:ferredoxin-NADP reductase